jgi:hypothetical protein
MDEDWDEEIREDRYESKVNSRDNNNNNNSSKFGSSFSSFSTSNYDDNRNRHGSDSNTRQSSGFSFGRGRLLSNKNDNINKSESFTRYRSPSNHRSYNDTSSSITEYMNIDVRSISTIIGRQGSNISNIRDKCNVKIFVPNRDEIGNQNKTEIKIIGQSRSNIEKAKEMIDESINSNRYGFKRNNPFENDRSRSKSPKTYFDNNNRSSNDNYSSSYKEESSGFACFRDKKRHTSEYETEKSPERREESDYKPVMIDWDAVRKAPTQNLSKFKDHPPVIKDFYVEDEEIKAMTKEDVIKFRKENFNIIVDLFKKENLSYLKKTNDDDEDKRTPEEKEAYLFENIPKPVKTVIVLE